MEIIYLNRDVANTQLIELNPITQGDSFQYRIVINENIYNWIVKARIYDDIGNQVTISNTIVSGLDEEISVESLEDGILILNFSSECTANFYLNAFLEIEIIDTDNKKQTILNGNMTKIPVLRQEIL